MKIYLKSTVVTLFSVALPVLVYAQPVSISSSKNTQVVTVKGSIVNMAAGGGTAQVNIGSVVGANSVSSNEQKVHVQGSIVNVAAGRGSKAIVNIGSVVK